MKGDSCGFLHQFEPSRMPVCRNLLKMGVCKDIDCPYKHTTEEIKECNMYRLGFCIYGPAVRIFGRARAGIGRWGVGWETMLVQGCWGWGRLGAGAWIL